MVYGNKKLIVNLLISSSFLLAGLGSVHGAKQAIDIVFNEGPTIRVTRNQIVSNTRFQLSGDENKAHIQIGSTHIDVDRSKPFGQLIRSLRAAPSVKSAILVNISPNERCTNTIREFNEAFRSDLPFLEKVKLLSKLCSSLIKYGEEDSMLAKKNLPVAQMRLGRTFVKSTNALSTKEAISPLRNAVQLFARAASVGYPTAKKNLSMTQYKLGCALANSAEGSVEEISFLQEAMELLTQSAIAGFQPAKDNLPLVQNNLGVALADSAQGSTEEISLRRKAVELLTQSATTGCQLAQRNLPIERYKLGVVLANSARSSADEVACLREARHLLESGASSGYQHAENQDILETLEKINQRLESLTAEAI